MSGREAIQRLQRAGFLATRQRGTLARIIKDANLTVEEFDALA